MPSLRSTAGCFESEIVPIPLEDGATFAVDEAPRRDTSAERLASLKPAFRDDGVVTAGNASQIVDGSAAMLIASEAAAARLDLTPRARFVSFGIAGVDPYRMLHGNPQACAQALRRAGLGWDDIAVIEINEAFASVVLQTLADTGLHERWVAGDVNPNGGGISLGHPLGATGARITATLLAELDRRERALRPRVHVHRAGPGDRSGRRTPLDANARTRRPLLRAGGGTRGDRVPRSPVCASRGRPE